MSVTFIAILTDKRYPSSYALSLPVLRRKFYLEKQAKWPIPNPVDGGLH